MDVQFYGHTDIGVKRETNQDSVVIKTAAFGKRKIAMGAICDGVGGLSCGERASRETAGRLSDWFDYEMPQIIGQEKEEDVLKNRWEQLIAEVNDKIHAFGLQNGIQLGTTMTAILIWDRKYFVAHVGDSRAYEIASDVYQITEDHSFLAREVRAGRMTEEEARKDRRGNLILQCIGASQKVMPAFYTGNLRNEVTFLLCSDGFWHHVENDELRAEFGPSRLPDAASIREHILAMTEMVKLRGETDNISVLIFRIKDLFPAEEEL